MKDEFQDRIINIFEQFIRNVTHEVNNPLTSIKGYSQLLELKKDKPDFVLKSGSIINGQVQRIEDIFGSLYRTFLLTEGETEEFSIQGLLSDLLNENPFKSNIEVNLPEEDIVLSTNREHLTFILNSIINNFDWENNGESSLKISYEKSSEDKKAFLFQFENVDFTEIRKKVFFLPYSTKRYFKDGTAFYESFVRSNLLNFGFSMIEPEKGNGFIIDNI